MGTACVSTRDRMIGRCGATDGRCFRGKFYKTAPAAAVTTDDKPAHTVHTTHVPEVAIGKEMPLHERPWEQSACSLVLHYQLMHGTHLHSLAQAHLICQDAIQVVVVQGHHPLQAHHLVLPQLGA
jgi:hypothetical protein